MVEVQEDVVVSSERIHFNLQEAPCGQVLPGANPTIKSYNASVVKIYNATNSLTRYLKKLSDIKRFSLQQRWSCRCKLKVVGLALCKY
jgi:hypothetical protein